MKYVLVTGDVVSSLSVVLKAFGLRVTSIKIGSFCIRLFSLTRWMMQQSHYIEVHRDESNPPPCKLLAHFF
ncbi:hypothetical protein ACS0TY_008615 [Phlomoides rotata]